MFGDGVRLGSYVLCSGTVSDLVLGSYVLSSKPRTKSDLAPRNSGKENHLKNVKPFIETLRVTNPVRQSRASSRKRVLRGDG